MRVTTLNRVAKLTLSRLAHVQFNVLLGSSYWRRGVSGTRLEEPLHKASRLVPRLTVAPLGTATKDQTLAVESSASLCVACAFLRGGGEGAIPPQWVQMYAACRYLTRLQPSV